MRTQCYTQEAAPRCLQGPAPITAGRGRSATTGSAAAPTVSSPLNQEGQGSWSGGAGSSNIQGAYAYTAKFCMHRTHYTHASSQRHRAHMLSQLFWPLPIAQPARPGATECAAQPPTRAPTASAPRHTCHPSKLYRQPPHHPSSHAPALPVGKPCCRSTSAPARRILHSNACAWAPRSALQHRALACPLRLRVPDSAPLRPQAASERPPCPAALPRCRRPGSLQRRVCGKSFPPALR